jgi:hypothetical protein
MVKLRTSSSGIDENAQACSSFGSSNRRAGLLRLESIVGAVRKVFASRWPARLLGAWSLIVAGFFVGYMVKTNHLFPSPQIDMMGAYLKRARQGDLAAPQFPYASTSEPRDVIAPQPGKMAPGLTLLSGIGANNAIFAKLVRPDGTVVHAWDLDWFRLWKDTEDYIAEEDRPKSRPGTHTHGVLLEPNGDLLFNYEDLGLVRVDACGHVLWRLHRQTHHSLYEDDDGNIWTSEVHKLKTPLPDLPGHRPTIYDYDVLKISPDGRVLEEINTFDLLKKNGYNGILYSQSVSNDSTSVGGDVLHQNDVEVFPKRLPEGFFKHGDIMVSLRNVNAIVILDPKTLNIKSLIIDRFIRQHDPDFVDGWTISVFDNNNVNRSPRDAGSRLIKYSLRDGSVQVVFQGDRQHPFYSPIMGKHQWLPNGDVLLADALEGRAIEVDPQGQVVWEMVNHAGRKDVVGLLSDAQRIPPNMLSEERLRAIVARCKAAGET